MGKKKTVSANKMAEVAARLGVSASTVSRALAGNTRISEETRRRVREATVSLGYRVDASASNLRTGLTRTIAVVIPLSHATGQRLSDPFFLEIIGAIGDELALRGYSMLLSKVTQPPGEWISSTIKARRADGIIVIGQSLHHDELNKAAAGGPAMTVWGARLRGQRYVTVGSDLSRLPPDRIPRRSRCSGSQRPPRGVHPRARDRRRWSHREPGGRREIRQRCGLRCRFFAAGCQGGL
jgi:DNA-binding LacI/PurR family transcriptional regulator